jgi:dephospho-CoA kinase
MTINNNSHYCLIVGKPAVGKTTVAKIILTLLNLPENFNYISIDKAHRKICDPNVANSAYSYDDRGTLTMHDSEFLMEESLRLVATTAKERQREQEQKFPIMIEFSHHDYTRAFSTLGSEIINKSVVLEIIASEATARQRNLLRPPSERVPDEYMNIAFGQQDDGDILRCLVTNNKLIKLSNEIDTTKDKLQQTVKRTLQQLKG